MIKNKKYCDRILTEDIKQMEKGKKKHTGTFVIHVSHCDNATWQGEVTWADESGILGSGSSGICDRDRRWSNCLQKEKTEIKCKTFDESLV